MKFFTTIAALTISLMGSHAAVQQPNILIFLVDDMGLMDTSVPFLADAEGKPKPAPLNAEYRTPNMARLAAQGTRFSHFYANSVCSPSRSSLVTGQYSARHDTTQWIDPVRKNGGPNEWNWKGISKDQVTLPRLMSQAGYTSVHIGKAHFGPFKSEGSDPRNVGFDINIAGNSIGRPTTYYGEKNYGKGTVRGVPDLDAYHGTKTFLTEALTLEANKTLTKIKDKPFFLHMSHYAVHGPFNSDPRFADNYAQSSHSKQWKAFATLIEGMDKSLGDILDHLEAIGEAENTLVFFLGDNGTDAPLGGQHAIACAAPLRGKKGSHYEGGMRAPLIVAWAKPNPDSPLQKAYPIRQNTLNNDMVTICDLMPTILNVTGIQPPANYKIDGHDIKKDLDGTATANNRNRSFLMHFPHTHRSSDYSTYFEGDWKITYHYKREKGKQIELFNLKDDPSESNNLSKSNPERSDRMLTAMIKALDDADAKYAKNKKTGKEMRPEKH